MFGSENMITKELKSALIDRLEGWELVDFLSIDIEDVISSFEEQILENIEDVREFIGLKDENNEYQED